MSKKLAVFVSWLIMASFVVLCGFGGTASAQKAPGVGPAATATAAPTTPPAPTTMPANADQLRGFICDTLNNNRCPAAAKAPGVKWNPDYVCSAPPGVKVVDKGTHCECQEGYIPFRIQYKWTPSRQEQKDSEGRVVGRYYQVHVRCDKSAAEVEAAVHVRVSKLEDDMRGAIAKLRQEIGDQRVQDLQAIYADMQNGDEAVAASVVAWVLQQDFVRKGDFGPIAKPIVDEAIANGNLWTNRFSMGLGLGVGAFKLPNSSFYAPCGDITFAMPFSKGSDWGANAQGRFCYGQGTNFNRDGSARWAASGGLTFHFTYALNHERTSQVWMGGFVNQIVRDSGPNKLAAYAAGARLCFRIAIPGTNGAFVPCGELGGGRDTSRDNLRGSDLGLVGGGSLNALWTF